MEQILLFFKIILVLLLAEGVAYGIVLVVLTKCISISHKQDEERMNNEGD